MSVNIRQKRTELHLTLEQIGNYVGVSKSTVKKWESGNIKNMRRDKILLLSEILQVSPLDFLNLNESNSPLSQTLVRAELSCEKVKKIEDALGIPLPEIAVLYKLNDKYILCEIPANYAESILNIRL